MIFAFQFFLGFCCPSDLPNASRTPARGTEALVQDAPQTKVVFFSLFSHKENLSYGMGQKENLRRPQVLVYFPFANRGFCVPLFDPHPVCIYLAQIKKVRERNCPAPKHSLLTTAECFMKTEVPMEIKERLQLEVLCLLGSCLPKAPKTRGFTGLPVCQMMHFIEFLPMFVSLVFK